MKRILTLTLAIVVINLLTGCGLFGPTRDINDPTNSLVFGYVDMDDAPTSINGAWLKQVAPPLEKPFWGMGADDGAFYNSYVTTGSYVLDSFTGHSFFKGDYSYNFPQQGNSTQLRITKPGIYYVGSFKYKEVKTGFFEAPKFAIEKIEHPNEAELLKRLLDVRDIKNSAWGDKIRARLAQLKP